jgi:hypothetical protein
MKIISSLLMVCAVAVAVMATACSTVDLPNSAYRDGWRRAEVMQLVSKDQVLKHADEDCRSEASNRQANSGFALVSYSYGGSPTMRKHRVARMPDGSTLQKGGMVYVNTVDCTASLATPEQMARYGR